MKKLLVLMSLICVLWTSSRAQTYREIELYYYGSVKLTCMQSLDHTKGPDLMLLSGSYLRYKDGHEDIVMKVLPAKEMYAYLSQINDFLQEFQDEKSIGRIIDGNYVKKHAKNYFIIYRAVDSKERLELFPGRFSDMYDAFVGFCQDNNIPLI